MKKFFYIGCGVLIVIMIIIIILLLNLGKNKNVEEDNEVITYPGEDMSFELNLKLFPKNYIEFESRTKKSGINNKRKRITNS